MISYKYKFAPLQMLLMTVFPYPKENECVPIQNSTRETFCETPAKWLNG